MSTGEIDLGQAASAFAAEVRDVLRATLPGEHDVVAEQLNDRYVVKPRGGEAESGVVPLFAGGRTIAKLRLSFLCHVDHQGRYLAIEKSYFILAWREVRNPLLRLEFDRRMHTAPAAHWQVHAERGALTALLAETGVANPHSLDSLHLPVGGGRMRPCLEDFIEFLIRDCGIDRQPDWATAVKSGRETWRRRQIGALVRDAPDEVVRVLAENGYSVTPPAGGALPGNAESLRRP